MPFLIIRKIKKALKKPPAKKLEETTTTTTTTTEATKSDEANKTDEAKKPQFEDILTLPIKKADSLVDSSVINSMKSTSLAGSYQNENKVSNGSTANGGTKGTGDLFDEHNFEINIDLTGQTLNSEAVFFFINLIFF